MGPPADILRGADDLRRVLAENTSDLRGLDPVGFRRWLDRHLVRWRDDPVFAQRSLIRDLRRASPDLRRLERAARRAAAADAASPAFPRLRAIDRELAAARKAIEGLTAALAGAAPDRAAVLGPKREAFRAKLDALLREQAELVRSSPERQELLRATAEWDRVRAAAGLDRAEAELERRLADRGRRSGRSGGSFEAVAEELTRRVIVPELGGAVHLLRGVTLGAARVEFDLLAVRESGGGPVEVLAAVEAKRNANDVAHGFRRRQEDLAWLTGETGGPEFRTARFPTGRFDRPTEHRQDGGAFRFDPGSFRRFRRDPATGWFLDGLYLVTRAGPLWGLSGPALARVGHRVATDARWDPDDDGYVGELLEWCRSLAEPVEAPDVLRLYAAGPELARQVVLVAGAWGRSA